jgi:hypothetical protein
MPCESNPYGGIDEPPALPFEHVTYDQNGLRQ